MMKSIATALAGIMFVLGFALVDHSKSFSSKVDKSDLKPSAEMLKMN